MNKFKRPEQEEKFIQGAEDNPEYPWESAFVRNNPEITKTISVTLPLEHFMKLEYLQSFTGERSRSQLVRDLLLKEIDKEIAKAKKVK